MQQDLTDREILKASHAIDTALSRMDKTNRGETAVNILTVARNLNDHIAYKIWQDLRPNEQTGINIVAKNFLNIRQFKFIGIFDTFLRRSVSHFTPSEDGAERLILKYFRYLLALKNIMLTRYNTEILLNVDKFVADTDKQTQDYYAKVANEIEKTYYHNPEKTSFDAYYICRTKPFYSLKKLYYEITLEPAEEKPNKFNRITAFTGHDIMNEYAVGLRFVNSTINVFGVNLPIKVISDWEVSIRPCELQNFAKILGQDLTVQRGLLEYKSLMSHLKEERTTLLEIVDETDYEYERIKGIILSDTKIKHLKIFDIFDKCRELFKNGSPGTNVLRYLMCRMNNRLIKLQWPDKMDERRYYMSNLCLHKGCTPFDKNPFSFNLKDHISNYCDLLDSINHDGRDAEILAHYIVDNAERNGILFTPLEDLKGFGTPEEIIEIVKGYNEALYSGFRPSAELAVHKNYAYNVGIEQKTADIISNLLSLTTSGSKNAKHFSQKGIMELKKLPKDEGCLDDPQKCTILDGIFKSSRVHFIYGAAGTGKSTLINHIASLIGGNVPRIFIAKTNAAVENLRRKILVHESYDEFITIDKFIRKRHATSGLVVVDECSTIKNEELGKLLESLDADAILVLAGDTYQIEAIGFGNWFNLARQFMPKHCVCELLTPYRSTDKNLKKLWAEVRDIKNDNTTLEQMVRNDYSNIIGDSIFVPKSDDEIILCHNYNGLYGLNNINRLLQIKNFNLPIEIGVWTFKKDDPVLFNDSERFRILHNNLKGRIVEIKDSEASVRFTIEVELKISKFDVMNCDGLELISSGAKSCIAFSVNRRPPYSSDTDGESREHILPFQVAYAVSIHKAQGLEYKSVKIVIADDSEERITHNVFYTAITRAKEHLTLFWSPEVCNRVLSKIKPKTNDKDYNLLRSIHGDKF
jgi:energy-coupling factor transporter ATP-binding protein EcfA2